MKLTMEDDKSERFFVGLNKGDHHSSVCLLEAGDAFPKIELFLNERLRGVKYAGGWPIEALESLPADLDYSKIWMAENSFGMDTKRTEEKWDENYLFFEMMKRKGLTHFSPHFNPKLRFFTHHLCHAMSATILSPFERSIIVVQDGVGNIQEAFPPAHEELKFPIPTSAPNPNETWAESCTIYLQNGPQLVCVGKEWQNLRPFDLVRDDKNHDPEDFSDGLGAFYGACAKFAFNSFHDAGKLMGLAPYGRSQKVSSRWDFLMGLDWGQEAFRQKGKLKWESSGNFERYADCAASVQAHFEESQFSLFLSLKKRFPDYDHLILTGGCALNCVFNMKALSSGLFKKIYVPPFPGDEGISLGAAGLNYYQRFPAKWNSLPWDKQTSSFGPTSSQAKDEDVILTFHDFKLRTSDNIFEEAAKLLEKGKIVAWYQGRSESGPRALGQRSILASPLKKGVKDLLNEQIKKRESFRPYGCSCLWEKASDYFQVSSGLDSPFMSFAPLVKEDHREILKEVTSIDGYSRIQTVRFTQNPRFYQLIEEFGKLTGLYCLLNTSLNIMGRPIVETIQDAHLFFKTTPVDALILEDFVITR